MSEFPFQKFLDLVAFDQSINKLEHEFINLKQEIMHCDEAIIQSKAELEEAKQQLTVCKKEVDSNELEMKELDSKQKEKQRLLDRVTNQREYQSLYQEIENLKKAQHNLN